MPEKIEGNDFKSGAMNQEEFIRSYLNSRLNETEKVEYKRLLATDPEFRKEVEFQTDLKATFSKMTGERMKAKLKTFEDELAPSKRKPYGIWLAAASVIVIIGVSLSLFLNNNASSDQLYMAYFKPYENVVQPITRGQSEEASKTEIFMAYEKGNYEKAEKGFQKLYETTNETYYLLYQANALMADHQLKKAIPLLEKQLAFNDEFAEKSRWYLALAYLKTGENTRAEELLREIVNKQGYKANAAKEILKKFE